MALLSYWWWVKYFFRLIPKLVLSHVQNPTIVQWTIPWKSHRKSHITHDITIKSQSLAWTTGARLKAADPRDLRGRWPIVSSTIYWAFHLRWKPVSDRPPNSDGWWLIIIFLEVSKVAKKWWSPSLNDFRSFREFLHDSKQQRVDGWYFHIFSPFKQPLMIINDHWFGGIDVETIHRIHSPFFRRFQNSFSYPGLRSERVRELWVSSRWAKTPGNFRNDKTLSLRHTEKKRTWLMTLNTLPFFFRHCQAAESEIRRAFYKKSLVRAPAQFAAFLLLRKSCDDELWSEILRPCIQTRIRTIQKPHSSFRWVNNGETDLPILACDWGVFVLISSFFFRIRKNPVAGKSESSFHYFQESWNMEVSKVMVHPVIIHFERWDFPVHKNHPILLEDFPMK